MREREMLKVTKFLRVYSFVWALINMVCELKITLGSKKNCVKISWWSDIVLESYQRKTVLRGHEIHSSYQPLPENNKQVQIKKKTFNSSFFEILE